MPNPAELATAAVSGGHPRRRRWLLAIAVVVIVLFGGAVLLDEVILPAVATHELLADGTGAPAITLPGSDGRQHSPLRADGPVVLEFFNTTCTDCMAQVPVMCTFIAAHPTVTVIGVEVAGHTTAEIRQFLADHGGGCLHYLVLRDVSGTVTSQYHIYETPTTYLIVNGIVRAAIAGTGSLSVIASALPAAPATNP